MSTPTRIQGDLFVVGNISATTMTIPDSAVDDDAVLAAAGIAATKLEHQFSKTYSQESATTAADESRVIHSAYGVAGTIVAFHAGCVVANIGDSTVTFDLKKNGTTVLSAVITVDSGDAARAIVDGTVTVTTLAADDVLEVVINATVGTGTLGKGAFATVILREDAQ